MTLGLLQGIFMSRFELITKGDECRFVGSLIESDDLAYLPNLKSLARFNFDQLKAINSLGLRALAGVMQKPEAQGIAFYACRPILLDALNVLPMLLGSPPNPKRVHSAYIRLICTGCSGHEDWLMELTGETLESLQAKCRKRRCRACAKPVEPEVPLEDELLFLTVGGD